MDEKFIERPKKFNQREYTNEYRKNNYVSICAQVKPELKQQIDDYCKDNNISKSEFLRLAIDTLDK